jgi:hypothetical protein
LTRRNDERKVIIMTIFVKEQPFIQGKEELFRFQDETVYIQHITDLECQRFSDFHIAWFYEEDTPVGYALIGIVSGEFFESVDDNEVIMEYVQPDKYYLYIPYLEIFKGYQSKELGTQAVSWLKNRSQTLGLDLLVYVTSDSEDFLDNQNFLHIDTWWSMYPSLAKKYGV